MVVSPVKVLFALKLKVPAPALIKANVLSTAALAIIPVMEPAPV